MTIGVPSQSALLAIASGLVRSDAPVEPDADEARRLVLDELSKPHYAAAQPTLFDRISQAVWEWLQSLTIAGTGVELSLLTVLLIVLAVVVIGAFLIFGMPRLRRRSTVTGPLFGVDEKRSAAQLRTSARRAANESDWTTAIEEQFRAIARALQERTILTPTPGTTAQGFASRATAAFPAQAQALREAATAFDDVRYLDQAGTEAAYERLVELDRELERAQAVLSRRPERVGA
ncbi:MAG: DUF4129 domain-containing protein [Cryobacterium sp.]|nr:DUF4129 domain-containing protein [Cryobacterium sp.]